MEEPFAFRRRVLEAVQRWIPDSGLEHTRQQQQQAQREVLKALLEEYSVWGPPSREYSECRVWLFDITLQVFQASGQWQYLDKVDEDIWRVAVIHQPSMGEWTQEHVDQIMTRLEPWQLLFIDLLRHSVYGGTVCEIMHTAEGHWWITARSHEVRTMNLLYRLLRENLSWEQDGALAELNRQMQRAGAAELEEDGEEEDEVENESSIPDDADAVTADAQDDAAASSAPGIDDGNPWRLTLTELQELFGASLKAKDNELEPGDDLDADLNELEPSAEELAQLAQERKQRATRKLAKEKRAKQKLAKRSRAAPKKGKR